MVYCVGLTGDIASGKTTVAHFFLQLGIEVIHADQISRLLTKKNEPAYYQIVQHYGSKILNKNKELNRYQLRTIIFSNSKERLWLESLLHPLIRQEIQKRVNTSKSPYCIVEIPLLITKQAYPYINRILLIRAPLETQIERIQQRDHCNREQALSILAVQPSLNLRLKNANDVIMNIMTHDELKKSIHELHKKYLKMSK